jgi:outer membrane immunogenic protein
MFLNKSRSDKLFFNKLVIGTALLVTSFSSYSQETVQEMASDNIGWYVGGLVGQVSSEFYNGPKENDTQFGVYAGYNFNAWFGLEGTVFSANQDRDIRLYFNPTHLVGFSITPKFTWAINDAFSLYAKVGLSVLTYSTDDVTYQSDYAYSDSGSRTYANHNDGDSWGGGGETLGVGAEFRIAKGIRLRIAYDYVDADIENLDYDYYFEENLDVKLSQASLGIHYQF